MQGPHMGGIVNLPAVLISLAITGMLVAGTRESATLNIALVLIKIIFGQSQRHAYRTFCGDAFQRSSRFRQPTEGA